VGSFRFCGGSEAGRVARVGVRPSATLVSRQAKGSRAVAAVTRSRWLSQLIGRASGPRERSRGATPSRPLTWTARADGAAEPDNLAVESLRCSGRVECGWLARPAIPPGPAARKRASSIARRHRRRPPRSSSAASRPGRSCSPSLNPARGSKPHWRGTRGLLAMELVLRQPPLRAQRPSLIEHLQAVSSHDLDQDPVSTLRTVAHFPLAGQPPGP
jgi:hypothetical protein